MMSAIFFAREAWAEDPSDPKNLAAAQTRMLDALSKIEARLTSIEEDQKKILDGQKQLSDEHTQLRYWVHRS